MTAADTMLHGTSRIVNDHRLPFPSAMAREVVISRVQDPKKGWDSMSLYYQENLVLDQTKRSAYKSRPGRVTGIEAQGWRNCSADVPPLHTTAPTKVPTI